MLRILTAAALAAFVATPALAQSSSDQGTSSPPSSSQQLQREYGTPSTPGMEPGASTAIPTDCIPNDTRPACQTAQMPGQRPGSSLDQSSPSDTSPSSPSWEQAPGSQSPGSGSMGGSTGSTPGGTTR